MKEKVRQILIFVLILHSVGAIPYPGDNASADELVQYYYQFQYTTKGICGFLILCHGIVISKSTVEMIKRRLGLRRRENRSDIALVLQHISELLSEGYANVGYRYMWRLLSTYRNLSVTQETVRLCMRAIDPVGVELRRRNRLHRRIYRNPGPNYLIHIDGYDKLKPYGIAIHGAIDGYSRRILWLEAGPSNNNPRYIAKFYLDFVKECRRVPRVVRSDSGTENVITRDLQMALRFDHNDDMSGHNSFLTGNSPANQRIERLWRNLSDNFTKFWRDEFMFLRDTGIFTTDDPFHINCARFCFLPLIKVHLQRFMETWNAHRIRRQRGEFNCPTGIPNVLYFQPELYDTRDYSFALNCSEQTLDELSQEYSENWPVRGCSEEFLDLASYLTEDNDLEHSLVPQSISEARMNFCVMVYACDVIRDRI